MATGFLGFDVARDRWLSGVAMSLSRGDGSFEPHETYSDGGIGGGTVENRLASLYPYARYRLGERTDVWAMAGYGTGELTPTERAGGNRARDVVTRTGLEMRTRALGARGRVVSPEEAGGLEVAVRTDAFWVRTESDAAELGYGLRAPAGRGVLTPYMGGEWSDGGVSRYRLGARWTIAPRATLGLEGSRRVVGDGGTIDALALRAVVRW